MPLLRPVHFCRRQAARLVRRGLDIVYPPYCVCCQTELLPPADQIHLCAACRMKLAPPLRPACPRCGGVVAALGLNPEGCRQCQLQRLHFDAVRMLGSYDGLLRQAVLRMKHATDQPLSIALGRLLATERQSDVEAWRPDVLTSIPMHWTRRVWRGTNNPELVAEQLARQWHIPCERACSSGRDGPQRKANCRGRGASTMYDGRSGSRAAPSWPAHAWQ